MTDPVVANGDLCDPDLWEYCLRDYRLYVAALRYRGQLTPLVGPVQLPYWPGNGVSEPGFYFTVNGIPIPQLPNPPITPPATGGLATSSTLATSPTLATRST